MAQRLQREKAARDQQIAMSNMQVGALGGGNLRTGIPNAPQGRERMSRADQAAFVRNTPRSMTGLPEAKRIPTALTGPATPQNTGVTGVNAGTPDFGSTRGGYVPRSNLGLPAAVATANTITRGQDNRSQGQVSGTTPVAMPSSGVGLPGNTDSGSTQPDPVKFGSTRNIPGQGLQSYMPDNSIVPGGGRWVATTGSTPGERYAATKQPVTPALDTTSAPSTPGGANGAVRSAAIPSQYQTPASEIGKGEIVGSGKIAPNAAVGTATDADSWKRELFAKHPKIFEAGTPENTAFVDAYKQHNDTTKAMSTADEIAARLASDRTALTDHMAQNAEKAQQQKAVDDQLPADKAALAQHMQAKQALTPLGKSAVGAVRGITDFATHPIQSLAEGAIGLAKPLVQSATGLFLTPRGQKQIEPALQAGASMVRGGAATADALTGSRPRSTLGLPTPAATPQQPMLATAAADEEKRSRMNGLP